jgi:predicted transglutaminase-like cysteine proteinase
MTAAYLAFSTPAGRLWRWLRGAALPLALLLGIGSAVSLDQTRLLQAARLLGPSAVEGLAAWRAMYDAASGLRETAKLEAVNRFFNQRIRFGEDSLLWAQEDYWATPLETLNKGAGDCEDYAIAKYFSLLALGLPPSRLRLIYVRAAVVRDGAAAFVPHMVLAYYPQSGQEPLVLDNLVDTIQPASGRPDLRPVFSFNTEGLWEQAGQTRSSVSLDRLSRWRDLLQRVGHEGFR